MLEAEATIGPEIGTDVLGKAIELLNGNRLEEYGDPGESFARIRDYWNVYLNHKFSKDEPLKFTLSRQDVAMLMLLMKVARLEGPKYTKDSVVDIIGYATLYDVLKKYVDMCKPYEVK